MMCTQKLNCSKTHTVYPGTWTEKKSQVRNEIILWMWNPSHVRNQALGLWSLLFPGLLSGGWCQVYPKSTFSITSAISIIVNALLRFFHSIFIHFLFVLLIERLMFPTHLFVIFATLRTYLSSFEAITFQQLSFLFVISFIHFNYLDF